MSTAKLAVGFAGPILAGVILGFIVGPIMSGEGADARDIGRQPGFDPDVVVIEQAHGDVQVRSVDKNWASVADDSVLRRPATFRTEGIDGYVRIAVKGARIVISQDAVVHLGAAGVGLTMHVERGLAVAYRAKQPVRAVVPERELDIVGQAFGIWVRPDQVNVAILEGDAEIRYRDATPERFAVGREVRIEDDQVEPSVMATELGLKVISERKSGSRYKIAGQTGTNARLFALDGDDGFKEVELTRGGTFSIRVKAERPAAGSLFAFDAAGRWAEFGKPSRRLGRVLEDLKNGADRRPFVVADPDEAPEITDERGRKTRRRPRDSDDVDRAQRSAGGDGTSGSTTPRRTKKKEAATPPPLDDAEDEELERAL